VQQLDKRACTQLRREKIGFVVQHFGLVLTFTVAGNIALPALFAWRSQSARVEELRARGTTLPSLGPLKALDNHLTVDAKKNRRYFFIPCRNSRASMTADSIADSLMIS
jgi:hypothetical protein